MKREKLSGASCSTICHCHEGVGDLLKRPSRKVTAVILVCFHLPASRGSLGRPAGPIPLC